MLFSGYKVSTLCIYMMNFAMAWDSFATFLSIYSYWTSLDAPYWMYGMVFACYALAQAIAAPFLGYMADKISIRYVVLVCLTVNIIGNLIYSLASCGKNALGGGILILGRVMAGSAAGCIILGLSYVTQLSSSEERIKVMNYYRVFGFIGRFFSSCMYPLAGQHQLTPYPVASIGLLFVPIVSLFPWNSDDGYCYIAPWTLPPPHLADSLQLTTVALDIIILIIAVMLLRNPPARQIQIPFWKDPETWKLFKYTLLLLMHFWAGCVTMWTVFSQIIPISIILYGISSDPKWFWLPYLPFFLGLVIGWASVLWPLSLFFNDRQLMLLSPFVMVVALFTFLQFSTQSPSWIFYIGTTVLYASFNVFNTAFQSYFSKVVGNTPYINTLMSTLLITGSFGQFCGPFLTTFFLNIKPKSGSSDQSTCCDPTNEIYDCCEFEGINFLIPLVMIIMLGTTIFQYFFIRIARPLDLQRDTSTQVVEASEETVLVSEKHTQEKLRNHSSEGYHNSSDSATC